MGKRVLQGAVALLACATLGAPLAGRADEDRTMRAGDRPEHSIGVEGIAASDGIDAVDAVDAVDARATGDDAGWGAAVDAAALAGLRGGADTRNIANTNQLSGTVGDNSAANLVTGSNSIAGGAFANASGLPMVIQNSGNNVLIQNSTIVNVQLQ